MIIDEAEGVTRDHEGEDRSKREKLKVEMKGKVDSRYHNGQSLPGITDHIRTLL